MMSQLAQGWGFPVNSRKAHYFLKDGVMSLCNKWMFAGERFDDQHDHKQNCAACMRLRGSLHRSQFEPKATA